MVLLCIIIIIVRGDEAYTFLELPLCIIIIVERDNKAYSCSELQLRCIIIRTVLAILLLVSSWNCTPVVKYHFTCPAAWHKKMLLLSSSTAACRRGGLDVTPKREHW